MGATDPCRLPSLRLGADPPDPLEPAVMLRGIPGRAVSRLSLPSHWSTIQEPRAAAGTQQLVQVSEPFLGPSWGRGQVVSTLNPLFLHCQILFPWLHQGPLIQLALLSPFYS
jgi:hypothetical protein